MLFELSSFTAAVHHEFGGFFGSKVPHVWHAISGVEPTAETQITAQDVGKILALLLVPDAVEACGPKGPELSDVVLQFGDREVEFAPERAKEHKLFGAWVGSNLAESLAIAFAASADLSIAAAGAPLAMRWEVGGISGALAAECVMSFGTAMPDGECATMTASYGATEAPKGLLSTRKLDGGQLARLAALTSDLTRDGNAASAALEAAAAASATLTSEQR